MTPEEIQKEVWNSPFSRFGRKLKAFSYRPINEHETVAQNLLRESLLEGLDDHGTRTLIDAHLPLMAAWHTKWARAVQPTGELQPDSAMVGAVRLNESAIAGQHLAKDVCAALSTNDTATMDRIGKLCRVELAKHRHYQVWVAIEQVREAGNFQPSKALSAAASKLLGRNIEWKFFPNYKEVRAHVLLHRDEPEFSDLRQILENDSAWSRVWRYSGARQIMEEGRRGPAAHPKTALKIARGMRRGVLD